jgi:tetratricopeptide (TPR) repeat protein
VIERLLHLIASVRENPGALEKLSQLFQQAGSTSHLAEVTELLAHAWVNAGELGKARDLYRRLAEMEPENPMHMQNYLQVLAQLGEEHAPLALSAPEDGPALLAAELDEPPPPIEQAYPPEVTAALQQSLTDAELYASYNLPSRAIPPLESALLRAPKDVQVNQRLASLYAREGRLMEAAQRCQVLQSVYVEAGRGSDAQRYSELVREFGPAGAGSAVAEEEPIATSASPISDAASLHLPAPAPGWFDSGAATLEPYAASGPESLAHEIDLSEEWERVIAQDRRPEAQPAASIEGTSSEPRVEILDSGISGKRVAPSPVDDIVEEVRFYLAQAMTDEARMALARAEVVAPNAPAVIELRKRLTALAAGAPPQPAGVASPASDALNGLVQDLEQSLSQNLNLAPEPPSVVSLPASPENTPAVAPGPILSVPESAASPAAQARPTLGPSGTSPTTEFGGESGGLADLFAEFKQDMESSAQEADDDPETHYNLGIAFKEMGLMDEAIGELQKVCQSIEHGSDFPRTVEAYTWLAHCFLETGVPEAGIKWYEKALQIRGLGSDSTIALHYELACAHEAAGHLADARRHFMQVLSSNIDYRDVAERVKALKS